jgi:GT2 family glycosyltransferase
MGARAKVYAGRLEMRMKISVIVASTNRPQEIAQLLERLAAQTLPPHEIVLSVVSEKDLPPHVPAGVKLVMGPPGLTLQRNRGLGMVLGDCDIVVFYDDDYLPVKTALAALAEAFAAEPGISGATGVVLADGVIGGGIDYETAMQIVHDFEASPPPPPRAIGNTRGVYGCNMAFRAAMICDLRFDENLPLHGWQEDMDFAKRIRARGPTVRIDGFAGVHRGVNKGRSPGLSLGFAQIVNPVYLVKKGAMTRKKAVKLIVRSLVSNHLKSIRPEPFIDRWGRVRGNWRGIFHLLGGRADPKTILTFK